MTTPSTQDQNQKKKHIFITGGSGYIGSSVTRLAIAAGYTVTGLSRTPAADAKLRALGAEPARGDLESLDVLRRESAAADAGVLHLADAWASDMTMPYDRVIEIDGRAVDAMVSGLRSLDGGGIGTLITTSGSLVVAADPSGAETTEDSPIWDSPVNGRVSCERQALAHDDGGGKEGRRGAGIRVLALRLAPFVYGRGGSGVRMFLAAAAAAGEATYVGAGATRITGVHVEDAARAYIHALESDSRRRGPYNITHETHVTARELAEAMGRVLGGLPVVSRSFEEVSAKSGGQIIARFLTKENRAANGKARRELGWEPKERGILQEITEGSYVEIVQDLLRKPVAAASGN